MKRLTTILLAGALALGAAACEDDDDDGAAVPDGGLPTGDAGVGPPAKPTPGAQVDRMGRPAINTALTRTFAQDPMAIDMIKDRYNADADPQGWATRWRAEFAQSLAILDALDRTCGNQLLAGETPTATRYDALANLLADDQIYIDTSQGTCTQYLAVESSAVGAARMDCGGRTPAYDVIDTTYSVLATGNFTGVTDAIDQDVDGLPPAEFPFLLSPN